MTKAWVVVWALAAVLSGCGPCRVYCPCGPSNPSDSCSACNACPDAGADAGADGR
ncbi:MAG: hypothetical protein U0269_25070 [Polyangiales bacterium]